MKVCFYSPYLPDSSIGGGEKHLFEMALAVAQDHQVYIAIRDPLFRNQNDIHSKYKQFFDLDSGKLTFIATPIGTSAGFISKLLWTRQFDYLFYWTDGSLFFSLAKHNNVHLQIPFTARKSSLIDRLKLLNWQKKNANSKFTKKVIESSWKTTVPYVIYPSVDNDKFDPNSKKQKIILSVGRFFRQLHSKRQDVLVEAFKEMVDSNPSKLKNWQLILIGANEDDDYVNKIIESTKGYNIFVHHDVSRSKLIEWYNKASIYWHATGFNVDEKKHPEKMEHFGISTVEAMAAGAVPVVINKGGQPEILEPTLKQNLWNDTAELKSRTLELIANKSIYIEDHKKAVIRAKDFDKTNFIKTVKAMIGQ